MREGFAFEGWISAPAISCEWISVNKTKHVFENCKFKHTDASKSALLTIIGGGGGIEVRYVPPHHYNITLLTTPQKQQATSSDNWKQ